MFNTHTGEFKKTTALDINLSRILTSAYSTYTDRSGLLWIGTAGYGLLKRNTRSELFHHTGNSAHYSIKETDKGEIILGSGNAVREVFDRTNGKLVDAITMTKKELQYLNDFLFLPIAADKSSAWFADSNRLRCYDKNLKKLPIIPCRLMEIMSMN